MTIEIRADMTPAEKRCFRRALRRHARRFAVRHPLTATRYYRDEAKIRYQLWRE